MVAMSASTCCCSWSPKSFANDLYWPFSDSFWACL